MYIIIAISLSILIYNIMDLFLKLVYKKHINFKYRMDIIKQQSLYSYSRQKKYKKQKQKLTIEVPEKLRESLLMAGVHLRAEEFLTMWGLLIIFPAMIAFALNKGLIIMVGLVALGMIMPPAIIGKMKRTRIDKFNNQLGDALLVISNSLRAGFTFEQALGSMIKSLPDPICTEFGKIIREVELGEKIEVSMAEVAKRMKSKDMELINTAVSIQRRVGGNLADVLDNIGGTIRERIIIKKNIKALTAQGEISGKIIALLPVILLIMISVVNKEYMEPMFTTSYGHIMLGLCVFLEVLGYLTIKKLINIEM
ncbi:tight adherence protein B [Tissierella praeacuta DSM 18095]|uniref:Tight adherence protein B n=1 Tax=Tissierella praeacuta DSM 18095 TaxID=1123404 RepID=A0A1M4XIN5_9FIRM|nr:type II secretion system F family protein [Tissierella praeacuta]SHE93527.1 tight adherence protein B [Tissierella praeacuta DSM 18095]SUP02071.1 Flp pilus assembly protein TadB [Tissierella praeacuta]